MRLWEIRATVLNYPKIRANLVLSAEVYSLGKDYFGLLSKSGLGTHTSPQEEALLRIGTRSLNLLQSVRRLCFLGYRISPIVLCASIIELYVYMKNIMQDSHLAQVWLDHPGTSTLWRLTGPKGLCRKLGLVQMEELYKTLCPAKHAAAKGMGLDSTKVLPSGDFHFRFEPIADPAVYNDLLGKATDASRVTLIDLSTVTGSHLPADVLRAWQNRLERFTQKFDRHFERALTNDQPR